MLAFPDFLILLVAFSAGVVAALGQAAIPYYIGRSIDFASIDPNPAEFKHGAVMLVSVAALLCAWYSHILIASLMSFSLKARLINHVVVCYS